MKKITKKKTTLLFFLMTTFHSHRKNLHTHFFPSLVFPSPLFFFFFLFFVFFFSSNSSSSTRPPSRATASAALDASPTSWSWARTGAPRSAVGRTATPASGSSSPPSWTAWPSCSTPPSASSASFASAASCSGDTSRFLHSRVLLKMTHFDFEAEWRICFSYP